MIKSYFVIFLVLFYCASFAQEVEVPSDTIETIILSSSRIETPIQKSTYSIHSVNVKELKKLNQQVSINEYLSEVPGVFAQNARNYAQDLRISIRGFGARSPFGIRGIKLVVDGVPETTPDGTGQIDNLDLGMIENMEILKGSSSGLYGNASGGVVSISTQQKVEKDFLRITSSFGSFNTIKTQVTSGTKLKKTDIIFNANHLRSDGYRDHSRVRSSQFSANIIHKANDKHTFKLLTNYTYSPTAEDPGGINLQAAEEDPRQAHSNNFLFNAGESISHFKTALQYSGKVSKEHQFDSQVFYANRQFEGALPTATFVDVGRNYVGHSSKYTYSTVFENGVNSFVIGYDMAYQRDQRDRFSNSDNERDVQFVDQIETFRNLAAYAINRVEMNNGLIINLNVRADNNYLKAEDKLVLFDDVSGSRHMNAINYGVGLNYQLHSWVQPYLRYGTSFETPTLSELATNEANIAGFNEDLNPQESSTYDLGVRGSGKHFSYELTGFITKTDNEIVSYEFAPFLIDPRTIYRNAGKTERKGLEANLTYRSDKGLIVRGSYTVGKYEFKEYQVDLVNIFDGESLPGIPDTQGSLSLSYPIKDNFMIRLNSTYTGKVYLNDSNSESYDPFILSNIAFRYGLNLGKHSLSFYGGINNLLSTDYMDNLRINAFGSRFFEPGPGRNFYLGFRYEL